MFINGQSLLGHIYFSRNCNMFNTFEVSTAFDCFKAESRNACKLPSSICVYAAFAGMRTNSYTCIDRYAYVCTESFLIPMGRLILQDVGRHFANSYFACTPLLAVRDPWAASASVWYTANTLYVVSITKQSDGHQKTMRMRR